MRTCMYLSGSLTKPYKMPKLVTMACLTWSDFSSCKNKRAKLTSFVFILLHFAHSDHKGNFPISTWTFPGFVNSEALYHKQIDNTYSSIS